MLATPILTNINSKAKIFFARTPIHFNFQNLAQDITIQQVTVEIYIWRGFQTADLPAGPSIVFNNVKKISPNDNYISIEIHNEIKSFITSSNLNRNNPQWAYNTTTPPTTSGEGVYFHIVYKVDAETPLQLGTYFATTGYRYNFEKKGAQYNTYIDSETERRYSKGVVYDKHEINLTTVASTSFSGVGSMITKTVVNPSLREKNSGVSCLIAYVDRLGKWDTFTPFGKFVETTDVKKDDYSMAFRNPLFVNSQIQHTTNVNISQTNRKFNINTGLISESNNYQIRELIQSNKIYLVIFGGGVYESASIGLTSDSTAVSADNTSITADNVTITINDLGLYSQFTQIPVKCNTNTFVKKTKLNNKSSISYELEFEESNNLLTDII